MKRTISLLTVSILSFVLADSVVASVIGTQALNPPYLSEMPFLDRVIPACTAACFFG